MMTRRAAAALVAAMIFSAGLVRAESGAHAFSFTAIEGGPMPMAQFAGRAVLLVNTASFCGFTPQFDGLQALWARYRDRGLVVLGTPSRDFGGQDYASGAQARDFCEGAYGVDFPMTELVRVRGADAHPLYRWAAGRLGPAGAPQWNFHKILIGPDGRALAGFGSGARPDDPALIAAIEAALPG